MAAISTHILDTSQGRPATGVDAVLEFKGSAGWEPRGKGVTDSDGRIPDLLAGSPLEAGDYRLTFSIEGHNPDSFYPEIQVHFRVSDPDEHHHIPLLLSPFGYSTYRGS
jgi:5-hydroxyisourate hydrolase